MKPVYLLAGRRSPIGSFLGKLSTVSAPQLGSHAIKSAIDSAKLDVSDIEHVMMGHVIQAGVGQAPARQAALGAGIPQSVPCVTVNKVCGSGLESIVQSCRAIATGEFQLTAAGGMESMSKAPFLIEGHRQGHKFGAQSLKDAMQWDGLWDVYGDVPMGACAEECAKHYKFSRDQQDEYAKMSFERAQKATQDGSFDSEIQAYEVHHRKGSEVIEHDEGPDKANFSKMAKLRPAFANDGSITAANASSINDGAAAVILGGETFKDKAEFKISGWAVHAQDPTWFTTAPVESMKKCLKKASLTPDDIDLFEVNEAFAVVALAAQKELEIPKEKLNVFGGAISLGHPIGCSGTRIVVTLMNALKKTGKKRGLASICIGGGEAWSLLIEKV